MATLLTTKLYIPRARPALVSRPRLIERLNEGLSCKLTLISAPPGFGKTTLLSEWVHALTPPNRRLGGVRVAWLSLDKDDNDPARFWVYFIAALQTVRPGVGKTALAALQSRQPSQVKAPLTDLINEIATASQEGLVLVLDDLHVINAPEIYDGIIFLLDHLPPQAHLVIASRADPPWPLARLRARREIVELRTNDLRFTPKETVVFFNDVMRLALSREDVAALDARTEGWIAGLQMAALSMQGRDDAGAFIQAFSGSHRFVLDYLLEEVLNRQSTDIQAFLLKTSILERLTAPLCNSVTGRVDSQAILTELEQANLFLVLLDGERRWYRYHHLFADLLRSCLEQTMPDQVVALHSRAAEWCERNGLIAEAVNHALAANDINRLVRLIETNAYAMGDCDLALLAERLSALPAELAHAQPWICVAQAWALVHTGQLDAIEPRLQMAERALAGPGAAPLGKAEVNRLAGHITAIRGYRTGLQGDFFGAIDLMRQALKRLPKDDAATRSLAATVLSSALRWTGRLPEATQAANEAVTMGQVGGSSNALVNVLGDLAILQIMQGQLERAAATLREALLVAEEATRRDGRQVPTAGQAYAFLSAILREWNDLEPAARYARQGVELCQQWGQANDLFRAHVHLARALQATGDVEGAWDATQEAKRVANGLSSWYVGRAAALEAWLHLMQGNGEAAAQWAQAGGLSTGDSFGFEHYGGYCLFARVLIAQGKLDEAWGLLERLLNTVEPAGAMSYTVEVLALQALALFKTPDKGQARGKINQAMTTLERTLTLAEPEGFVRTFVDEGDSMRRLLQQAAACGVRPDYVNKLLVAFSKPSAGAGVAAQPSIHSRRSKVDNLVEPLSERELEVLRLLATSLSTTEIAEELVISANTIRSHIKSIYSKLDVHHRIDAVERAREMGLLG